MVKISDFEQHMKKRLKIGAVDLKFHRDFTTFLNKDQRLNFNPIGRYFSCIKTICKTAKQNGIKVSPEFDHDAFRRTKEKSYFVTLSEAEIDKILNNDLSATS